MSANCVEKLMYWRLCFNGNFTVENFTVHPGYKKQNAFQREPDFAAPSVNTTWGDLVL